MDTTTSLELGHVARDLDLSSDQVQRTVELLDEGNTVPFITRYRKDQTGGLDEEQIRRVQSAVVKLRLLAERKKTILKSIEAQGKLVPELAEKINSARSMKHLEDLYLPFKPKKQTLATAARLRGLEPLADEIYDAVPAASNIEARAAEFMNPEHKLGSVAEVLTGVGHILAERFSERADVRHRLRRIFQRSGRLLTTRIELEKSSETEAAPIDESDAEPTTSSAAEIRDVSPAPDVTTAVESAAQADATASSSPPTDHEALSADKTFASAESVTADGVLSAEEGMSAGAGVASDDVEDAHDQSEDDLDETDESREMSSEAAADDLQPAIISVAEPSSAPSGPLAAVVASVLVAPRVDAKRAARVAAREAKKKKRQKLLESAFKDYYQYQEPLGRVPPHRILAINRGERARVLRVKIEADVEAMTREAEEILVPRDHPHAEILRGWLRDALNRLVFPSLERELRREMTEKAETHAVEVFVRNLRKLLLQPPVHGRRVLAIDPGFRSGCKFVAIDEFGNVIDHGMIHIIGSEQHRQMCRSRLVEAINKHNISAIAIGNGTACRETELLIADVIANELTNRDIAYVIVNEAGASVYSTSPIGREELPKFDATVRGAVSIGRRLLDPLSELVKINPANIGVGLYQHDVKAKHLQDSLDAVVESCVNYVGVDVNTASPALLRYASGLNQLTARRVYEYRLQHGPFRNREQFKQVPGFGDATFVQAAGFLKIIGGDNPLDATWIHPESYEIAQRVLDKLGSNIAELTSSVPRAESSANAAKTAAPTAGTGTALFEPVLATPEIATATATMTEPAVVNEPTVPTVLNELGLGSNAVGATDSTANDSPVTVAASIQDSVSHAAVSPASASNAPASDVPGTNVSVSQITVGDTSAGNVLAVELTATGPAVVANEPAFLPDKVSDPDASPSETSSSAEGAAVSSPKDSLAARIDRVDSALFAQELSIGKLLLDDILVSLARPGRDPREDLPHPAFRRGIMKLEDLTSGMELSGTVLNVVDFGAFVDIGLSDSALVHISRLADRYVRDPHEVVGVGDVLKVWVVDVDKQRRRVSLTAIAPGTEKPQEQRQRPPRPEQRPRPARPARPAAQQTPAGAAAPSGSRPARPQQSDNKRPARPQKFNQPHKEHKPKPVKPITKGMIDGKEPMRTFSDLMQFYKKKQDDDAPPQPEK